MISCFNTIESELINESLYKFYTKQRSEFDSKTNTKNNNNRSEETDFILGKTEQHFSKLYSSQLNNIINLIDVKSKGDKIEFNTFISKVYNSLDFLLAKEVSPIINNTNYQSIENYGFFVFNDYIRVHLNEEFILPLIYHIESNYLHNLIDNDLIPIVFNDFLHGIIDDTLSFAEVDIKFGSSNNSVFYSNSLKKLLVISYNRYYNLSDFKNSLEKLLDSFKKGIDRIENQFTDPDEKLNYYNIIKERLNEVLSLYQKAKPVRLESKYRFAFHYRKASCDVFQQKAEVLSCSESKHKALSLFFNFQDIQYQIAYQASIFIETKMKLIRFNQRHANFTSESKTNEPNNPNNGNKIKTKLSVSQLGYLIRCFVEEKDILQYHTKIGLIRQFTQTFSSIQKEDFSEKNLNKNYKNPSEKDIEYWIEKFTHFLQYAKRNREELRS